ncbi:DUF934 domain-containing protein [Neoaquamicrobium sediminum]|uniref:DUF934 domain-containing protein n=1 Tax=Neoaquamicrobium sediminum TaxID=1849104 RepID=UPI001567A2C7|nr:DUF934 domain-containing protein [Mesorhizobium sediminum]NRC53077.1 DUF934 domain-containing protein [Mesorhizobium sediminum]
MSETETVTRLWTPDGFREEEWSHAEDAQALAGNQRVILPLAVFLDLDDATRAAAADRIGVHVLPGEALDALLPFLSQVSLISLGFPAFNDGRSYSKAELLRSRHGYGGTIRASGDVLIDQIPLMIRTGFSEFEVTNETALSRLGEGRVGGIPFHYQPAAKAGDCGAGYSWRRRPAA